MTDEAGPLTKKEPPPPAALSYWPAFVDVSFPGRELSGP